MPVHPHLADLAVFRLAEDRPACIYLFPRASTPKRAAKLRGKPRPRHIHLARGEVGLGLVQRNVLPVRPNRREPVIGLAEGRLEKHRVVAEDRADHLDVALLPPLAERVDQRAILVHARNILLVALLSFACRPPADDGFTLLFLGRSAAAHVGRYSWAPDATHSR